MGPIYPKQFIQDVLIDEYSDIVKSHAYLSFLLICSGIEFLGRCIDSSIAWSQSGVTKACFSNAIEELFPSKYLPLSIDLYKSLRNGMTHTLLPGSLAITEIKNIDMTELNLEGHPFTINGRNMLVIEYFFEDFSNACRKVMQMDFSDNDKMSLPLIHVGSL